MKKIYLAAFAILSIIPFVSNAQNTYPWSQSGDVGIGTSTPAYRFQVNTGTNQNLQVRPYTFGSSGIFLNAANDANTVSIPLEFGASKFSFNIGSVGIGTASPTANLDVRGTLSNTVGDNLLRLGQAGGSFWAGLRVNTTADLNFDYFTGAAWGTAITVLHGNGNVGIGTTSPSQLLDVNGAAIFGTTTSGSQGRLYIDAAGGSRLAQYSSSGTLTNFFQSNGVSYINGGNVGIGTITPGYHLQLEGSNNNQFQVTGLGAGYGGTVLANIYSERAVPGTDALLKVGSAFAPNTLYVQDSGNVGIGTTSPDGKLNIAASTATGASDILERYTWSSDPVNWGLRLEQQFDATHGRIQYNWLMRHGTSSDIPVMSFAGGHVGIGTITPDELLAVNGTIHSKEVKVNLIGLPDYVFKPDYHLPTLSEVKTFIDKNQHLPEMPSAQEVEKNGLNLGEMNKLLLKKVEELTLYLIDKDKQINELKQAQQNQIDELRKQVGTLLKKNRKKH